MMSSVNDEYSTDRGNFTFTHDPFTRTEMREKRPEVTILAPHKASNPTRASGTLPRVARDEDVA